MVSPGEPFLPPFAGWHWLGRRDRARHFPATRRGPLSYASVVRMSWPLTGRAAEMSVIEAAILAPGVPGVVVCGEAGDGGFAAA